MKKEVSMVFVLSLVWALPASGQASNMSFFITSSGTGFGADLGGLSGADAHCQDLAYTAGHGDKVWRAYLSAVARDGGPSVNARDRIGSGPWHNFNGVMVARDVTALHAEDVSINKESALTERGDVVNGRGDSPNQHDILTGSNLDGTVYTGEGHTACGNWTSSGSEGSARVGHFDRTGGGENPTSWNSAHSSRGCSQENLVATGGNGYFYCFAVGGGAPGEEE